MVFLLWMGKKSARRYNHRLERLLILLTSILYSANSRLSERGKAELISSISYYWGIKKIYIILIAGNCDLLSLFSFLLKLISFFICKPSQALSLIFFVCLSPSKKYNCFFFLKKNYNIRLCYIIIYKCMVSFVCDDMIPSCPYICA